MLRARVLIGDVVFQFPLQSRLVGPHAVITLGQRCLRNTWQESHTSCVPSLQSIVQIWSMIEVASHNGDWVRDIKNPHSQSGYRAKLSSSSASEKF